MKEEIRAILEAFLSKPTQKNLDVLNNKAKEYTSEWIESKYLEITPKKKTYNKAQYELISEIPNKYGTELEHVSLKEKKEHNKAPYYVICFRDSIKATRKKDKKEMFYNRRFYFHGGERDPNKMPWIIETAPYIAEIFETAYKYKIFSEKYHDHRRNIKIPLSDQYVSSSNLTNDEKLHYLKDLVSEDEHWGKDGYGEIYGGKEILSDVDQVSFVIDLYAGDAHGDGDGSDIRKTLIMGDNGGDGLFTIRTTTTNKKHKPCVLIDGSKWRIDNSMPEISAQTAEVFYKYTSPDYDF